MSVTKGTIGTTSTDTDSTAEQPKGKTSTDSKDSKASDSTTTDGKT